VRFEVALSFRTEHAGYLNRLLPLVDAFEVIVDESRLGEDSLQHEVEQLGAEKHVVFHSLDLSPGSADLRRRAGIDEHLAALEQQMDSSSSDLVTDHLSFSRVGDTRLDNFVPVPFHADAVSFVAENLRFVKSRLGRGRELGVENICYYLCWPENSLDEADFLNAIMEQADVSLLLDLNNLYVNAINHRYDPHAFLDRLHGDRVAAIHLAGHELQDGHLMDTHSRPVAPEVWDLLDRALEKTAARKIILEWDSGFDADALCDHLTEIGRRVARQAVRHEA
jgi:uncharacterized protein (UPF0276 family)